MGRLLAIRNLIRINLAVAFVMTQGCIATSVPPRTDPTVITGLASWYGQEFSGRATANGEIFDPMLLTAAHRELPFGTLVEVRNTQNNRTVQVRINDRGPFVGNRIIDLSWAAAEQIGMVKAGVVPVELLIIAQAERPGDSPPRSAAAMPVDAPPPPIPFPLPHSSPAASSVDESELVVSDIDVLEVRGGVEVRKRVGPDGVTIEGGTRGSGGAGSSGLDANRVPSGFVVQLGSFLNKTNAESLLKKVHAFLRPAYVEQRGDLYRVRVGPFKTREAAIEARERLESAGFSGVLMTAEGN